MRRTGGSHIRVLSNGVRIYGNANLTLGQVYFPWMLGPNVVIGDPVNGAGFVYRGGRKNRPAVTDLIIRDSILEGTHDGNILFFGGCRNCAFRDLHMEMGESSGTTPNVGIGMGACQADGRTVCGTDRHCGDRGVCVVPGPTAFNRVVFSGGGISSDNASEHPATWSPIFIGKGATSVGARIIFEMTIQMDRQPDGGNYLFDFDPAANVWLDFSRSVMKSSRIRMPRYRNAAAPGSDLSATPR